MVRWAGATLTFLGFLGVVPVAWGVKSRFLEAFSSGSAGLSPEARLGLLVLLAAGFILAAYSILQISRNR